MISTGRADLSEDMEKAFGGVGMYINGPCADLSAKKSYDGHGYL